MFFDRLRRFVNSRLQPPYLALVSGAIVVISLVLAAAILLTSDQGETAFGIPPGADFSGFYVAAQIIDRGDTRSLYDVDLHDRLYHELLPHEDARTSIPYVHPPFVAGLIRPLVWISYEVAVAVWLAISAALYSVAVIIVLKSIPLTASNAQPHVPAGEGRQWNIELVLLLALSFEPFAFECWLGGQLSSIAFFSVAIAFAFMQRKMPFLAGIALGLCFYKPTILLLVLPMLLIGRRWKMLLGMTVTGIALAGLSLVLVGWDVNVGYLDVLLSFQKRTSGGDLEIRTWKYVDLNNCLRQLLGNDSEWHKPLLVMSGLLPFGFLSQSWWRWDRLDRDQQCMLWAATLTWTPLLNLYFGIYDSVLVVQSALITAAILIRKPVSKAPLTESGLAWLLALIYAAPWFSQSLARVTGIPVYSLLLMGLGTYQCGRLIGATRVPTIQRHEAQLTLARERSE